MTNPGTELEWTITWIRNRLWPVEVRDRQFTYFTKVAEDFRARSPVNWSVKEAR